MSINFNEEEEKVIARDLESSIDVDSIIKKIRETDKQANIIDYTAEGKQTPRLLQVLINDGCLLIGFESYGKSPNSKRDIFLSCPVKQGIPRSQLITYSKPILLSPTHDIVRLGEVDHHIFLLNSTSETKETTKFEITQKSYEAIHFNSQARELIRNTAERKTDNEVVTNIAYDEKNNGSFSSGTGKMIKNTFLMPNTEIEVDWYGKSTKLMCDNFNYIYAFNLK